jgi:hypothetical protein
VGTVSVSDGRRFKNIADPQSGNESRALSLTSPLQRFHLLAQAAEFFILVLKVGDLARMIAQSLAVRFFIIGCTACLSIRTLPPHLSDDNGAPWARNETRSLSLMSALRVNSGTGAAAPELANQ